MVSQVLFGEHFKVLEKRKKWSKIRLQFDNYEGYIDNKQFEEITESLYTHLSNEKAHFSGELIDFITDTKNQLQQYQLEAKLPFFENNQFSIKVYVFLTKELLILINYLNQTLFKKHLCF